MVEGVIEANRAEIYLVTRQWAKAEASCARSMVIAERRRDPLRHAEALRVWACLAQARKNYRQAERALEEAGSFARQGKDALLLAEVLRELGEVSREKGDMARAREVWGQARDGFCAVGAQREVGDLDAKLASLAA
jgi:hypothetical protein